MHVLVEFLIIDPYIITSGFNPLIIDSFHLSHAKEPASALIF